jgi:tol-pal system protein YbgF
MAALRFWLGAGIVSLAALGSGAASAQLFGDDEARKAILELRERVETNRRQTEAQLQRLSADFSRMNEETATPTRRALLDLGNRIEALKQDMARLTGQSEQLARDVADMQRQQKDVLTAFDERLRKLEPAKVSVDGQEFQVAADERQAYEQAMEAFRKSQFDAAATGFGQLLRGHPQTGYGPSAWFWLGNSHYATGKYKEAMDAYRKLMAVAPDHARVPEARLALANCQLELKDAKGARKTLEDLVKASPQSEAAAAAKDRLSRMR